MTNNNKQDSIEFTLTMPNEAGRLEKAFKVLCDDVNIQAVSAHTESNVGIVRFITDNVTETRRLLKADNWQYTESPVYMIQLPNRPGALVAFLRNLSKERINILHVYGTTTPNYIDDDGGPGYNWIAIATEDSKVAETVFNRLSKEKVAA